MARYKIGALSYCSLKAVANRVFPSGPLSVSNYGAPGITVTTIKFQMQNINPIFAVTSDFICVSNRANWSKQSFSKLKHVTTNY